jgi:hypothetical protein
MTDSNSLTKVNALVERTKDRVMAMDSSLLNALISVDGVFISAASIVIAVRPTVAPWFLPTVIGSCTVSILLVIWNYYTGRRIIRGMGRSLADMQKALASGRDISADLPVFAQQVECAENAYRHNSYREAGCFALLLISVVAFAVVLSEQQ